MPNIRRHRRVSRGDGEVFAADIGRGAWQQHPDGYLFPPAIVSCADCDVHDASSIRLSCDALVCPYLPQCSMTLICDDLTRAGCKSSTAIANPLPRPPTPARNRPLGRERVNRQSIATGSSIRNPQSAIVSRLTPRRPARTRAFVIRLAATIAFFAALPAGVAATATLHASERQDPRTAFHQAHFEVQNSTGSVVAAVAFRARRRADGPGRCVDSAGHIRQWRGPSARAVAGADGRCFPARLRQPRRHFAPAGDAAIAAFLAQGVSCPRPPGQRRLQPGDLRAAALAGEHQEICLSRARCRSDSLGRGVPCFSRGKNGSKNRDASPFPARGQAFASAWREMGRCPHFCEHSAGSGSGSDRRRNGAGRGGGADQRAAGCRSDRHARHRGRTDLHSRCLLAPHDPADSAGTGRAPVHKSPGAASRFGSHPRRPRRDRDAPAGRNATVRIADRHARIASKHQISSTKHQTNDKRQ